MQREIVDYAQDEEGHWVARLSCGHDQHVRHQPPFHDRAWALDPEERSRRLGLPLECPPCERSEMPAEVRPYRRTPTFTEETVPAALLRNHNTKPGVWGQLTIESGELEYCVGAKVTRLDPTTIGVIVPEVEHCVRCVGPVRFHVEFWQRPLAD